MEMVMPMNYVEMTDEEMMYVDGGYVYTAWQYTGVAVPTWLAGYAIDAAASFGASAVVGAFGLTINTLRRLAGLGSLSLAAFDFGGRVARALDKNGNGYIGLHYRGIYTGKINGQFYGFVANEHKTE